jgi:hypothetical protein
MGIYFKNYCMLKEAIDDREHWEIVISPKTRLTIHIEEEKDKSIVKRDPCFYWHFVDWTCISFGFHVDFYQPNIEIHLPFGFFRFGWLCRKEWKES